MLSRHLITAAATAGVGRIPFAPGTWGSLVGAMIWWFIGPLTIYRSSFLLWSVFILGWLVTHFYEQQSQKHDPKEVVIDEVLGVWIALLSVPHTLTHFVVGFVLFRLFDIWKPFPVGWIDRNVKGALGTMLDDVVAGVMARVSLYFIFFYGSSYGFLN